MPCLRSASLANSIGGTDPSRKGVVVRGKTRALALATAGAVVAAGIVTAPAARAADSIVVWADSAHASVIEKLTAKGVNGTPV